jgi:hypothetical protein
MLASAITLERFETIAHWLPQVAEVDGSVKVAELAARNLD